MKKQVRISDEETVVLQELAASVPAHGLIVEIGAAWGWSCSRWGSRSPTSWPCP